MGKGKRKEIFFGITIVLLLLPFVSRLFNDQVNWDILDYSDMYLLFLLQFLCFFIPTENSKKPNRAIR